MRQVSFHTLKLAIANRPWLPESLDSNKPERESQVRGTKVLSQRTAYVRLRKISGQLTRFLLEFLAGFGESTVFPLLLDPQ